MFMIKMKRYAGTALTGSLLNMGMVGGKDNLRVYYIHISTEMLLNTPVG